MNLRDSITKNVRLNSGDTHARDNASGCDAKESLTPFANLRDDEVISLVNRALLGNVRRDTSYKFVFFKSILDNLFNVDLKSEPECFLSFDTISLRFAEIYWNLVVRFGLKQRPLYTNGNKATVERIFEEFCQRLGIPMGEVGFPFESLRQDLQLELSKAMKKSIVKKYVLGAFCADTGGQFYHFSTKRRWDGIYLNKSFFTVLAKYRSDFEKINYFEWIKFLEGINREEDSYMLASKLDRSTERENLNSYRKALLEFGQAECFYCGKKLSDNAVDHFIPWSFVKDDRLWNFVLACPSCNSRKSDRLTSQTFLSSMRSRNERLGRLNHPFVQAQFKGYEFAKLALMYQNAIFNGFQHGWEPTPAYP